MSYIIPFEAGCIKRENRLPYSVTPYDYTRGIVLVNYPSVRIGKYAVTTEGKIINLEKNIEVVQYHSEQGYKRVSLSLQDTTAKQFMVHRIVAYAFCNPPSYIENYVVNHIDGNKSNNCCGNLEWISSGSNIQHSMHYLHGDKLSYVGSIREEANERMIRNICVLFTMGKTDTEVMTIMGMAHIDANYSFLQDIRKRRTWVAITKDYNFRSNSVTTVYDKHTKEKIKDYYRQGYRDPYKIYELVENLKYMPSKESARKINAIKRVYGSMYKEFPLMNKIVDNKEN